MLLLLAEPANERLDCRRLVSLRRQVRDDLEPAHAFGIARSASVMARSSSAFTVPSFSASRILFCTAAMPSGFALPVLAAATKAAYSL